MYPQCSFLGQMKSGSLFVHNGKDWLTNQPNEQSFRGWENKTAVTMRNIHARTAHEELANVPLDATSFPGLSIGATAQG